MFSSQHIYITHVKQTHLLISQKEFTDAEIKEIAYSQFNVCRAVIANPDALVVQESLYENYTPELVPKNQFAKLVKNVFPEGIPEKFFFFKEYGNHRDLHSFPTRRSSD